MKIIFLMIFVLIMITEKPAISSEFSNLECVVEDFIGLDLEDDPEFVASNKNKKMLITIIEEEGDQMGNIFVTTLSPDLEPSQRLFKIVDNRDPFFIGARWKHILWETFWFDKTKLTATHILQSEGIVNTWRIICSK